MVNEVVLICVHGTSVEAGWRLQLEVTKKRKSMEKIVSVATFLISDFPMWFTSKST